VWLEKTRREEIKDGRNKGWMEEIKDGRSHSQKNHIPKRIDFGEWEELRHVNNPFV
jgi:hypothetical protein